MPYQRLYRSVAGPSQPAMREVRTTSSANAAAASAAPSRRRTPRGAAGVEAGDRGAITPAAGPRSGSGDEAVERRLQALPLVVRRAVGGGLAQAALHVVLQHQAGHSVDGGPDGRQLDEDVRAVPPLLHHAPHGAQVPLGA